jgi:hypothetical protein
MPGPLDAPAKQGFIPHRCSAEPSTIFEGLFWFDAKTITAGLQDPTRKTASPPLVEESSGTENTSRSAAAANCVSAVPAAAISNA